MQAISIVGCIKRKDSLCIIIYCMYDIHCHLMPGVEDGADNMEETIQMAQLAASGGTKGIAVTPHCRIPGSYQNLWSQRLEDTLSRMRSELDRRGIPIILFQGQEVFLAAGFLELLKEQKLITINHSRYLLVEFDFYESGASACQKLRQIAAEGYVPIVAHPERYAFFAAHSDAEVHIKAAGALLQVNKGSLKGSFGRTAFHTAHRLLDKRMADFVASDGHSPYVRTPFLRDVHEIINERYSADYADYLLKSNPSKVIENDRIYQY